MKRSPINFRPILLVPKSENPKGLAVFVSSLFILSQIEPIDDDTILHLLRRLIALTSPDTSYFYCGYNSDWQSRASFLPKFHTKRIYTTFAVTALLHPYHTFADNTSIDMPICGVHTILHQ